MAYLKKPNNPNRFTTSTMLLLYVLIGVSLWRVYISWFLPLNNLEATNIFLFKNSWHTLWTESVFSYSLLYNALMKIWIQLFGMHVFSIRLFSVILSLGSVYLSYYFIKLLFKNEKLALTCALLVGINPFLIIETGKINSAALLIFLTLITGSFLVKSWFSKKALNWVFFVLSLVFTLDVLIPSFSSSNWKILLLLLFTFALTWAIYQIPKFTTRRYVIIALGVICIGVFVRNWHDLDLPHRPGIKGAAYDINQKAQMGEKIYLSIDSIFNVFSYYNQTAITPRLFVSEGQKNDNIWVIWTNDNQSNTKPIIPGNWNLVSEQNYPDSINTFGDIVVSQYHVVK